MDDYKIGDEVIITGYPGMWDSTCNIECPANAKFPLNCKINDLKEWGTSIAISAGGYGHSLLSLIEKGMISHKSPEIELVEGKWYEFLYENKYRYVFKFDRLEGHKVYSSKHFHNHGLSEYKKSTSNSYLCDINDKKYPIKPANLEEVYKYFSEERPKERVNSNTDFIFTPGNVYVGSWDSNRVIFKPSNACLDKPSDLINADDQFKTNQSYVCTGTDISFRDATKEEKDWLERCLKANKLVPKESPMKEEEFKVGDRVECTKLQYSFIPVGKKGKVIGPPKEGWVSVSWEDFRRGHNCDILEITNKSGYYIQKENIKLIPSIKEESSIPEYRIINNSNWASREFPQVNYGLPNCYNDKTFGNEELKGKTVKVIEKKSNGYYLCQDNNGKYLVTSCYNSSISTESAYLAQNKPIPSPSIGEDWCVALDSSNKENILEWSRSIGVHGYQGTSKYYGVYTKSNIVGKFWCETSPWGKLLTTEQFYTKIGKSMPNKEITLIKDGYYSCIYTSSNEKYFFKFDRIESNYLYVKGYRSKNCDWIDYKTSTSWVYADNSQFKEVTESEAKGIIAPVKEENLVGRWAKVITNHEFGYLTQSNLRCNSKSFYTIGKIGRIIKDDEKWSDKITKWIRFEGCNNAITLNQLELMPLGWSPEAKSIDSMSKEELLIEAKKRYPVNTIVNSLVSGYDKCRIKEYGHPSSSKSQIWVTGELTLQNNRAVGTLIYDNSKSPMWAEIVEKAPIIQGIGGEFPASDTFKHTITIDELKQRYPYEYRELSISDVFKPKKSAKMSYIAENSQSPRQLSKVVKIKSIQI